MLVLLRFVVLLLFFQGGFADVWRSTILLLNNQDRSLTLGEPQVKHVEVTYPHTIGPYQKGEIELTIDNSWVTQALASVDYRQFVTFDHTQIELKLTKRHPDFELKKTYEPGFDCGFDVYRAGDVRIERLFKSNQYCDIISFSI